MTNVYYRRMPEVNGNDSEVRAGSYINLIPCATTDPEDLTISHMYEARQVVDGQTVGALGWLSLGEARQQFADQPYAVRYGSHSMCPTCAVEKFGMDE